MKKIGIITFHTAYNYGSVLQTIALQTFLEKNGYQVDILNFHDKLDMRQYKLLRTHYYFFPPIIFEDLKSYNNNKQRIESYKKFNEKYMNTTKEIFYNNDDLKKIANEYDVFICGSDQIWNTSCTRGAKPEYFLNFAKDSNAMKISYAPSIAHSQIEDKYKEGFKEQINNIDVISIREKTGQAIIKDLTGKESQITLDPTLLLEKNDYDLFIKPLKTPKKYVYVYCLEYNKEVYNYASNLAKEKGCELVYFRKHNMKIYGDSLNSFPYSPGEFLYLIKNASYIVTNSFHATVFSILFERQFTTFVTKRSASRMVDFLTELGIDDRIYHKSIDLDKQIDYYKVKTILNDLKSDSVKFLLDNLG